MVNDSDREAVDALPFGFGSSEELITKAFSAHRRAAMLEGARLGIEAAARLIQINYAFDKRALVPAIRNIDPATVIKESE